MNELNNKNINSVYNIDKDTHLEVVGLSKYHPVYKGFFKKHVADLKALDNVSVSVKCGETLGLVGESGCGKTTFGKNVLMLQKKTKGDIYFNFGDGNIKDITTLKGRELLDFKKEAQMIFQDPYSALNPSKKIIESFEEPMNLHGITDHSKRMALIKEIFEMVNLHFDYVYRYPHEFSGGQRQRICIARALCVSPKLVVCDEPVSALDVSIQAQVLNLMKDIQKKMNLTYIFIAHDLSVVEYMSDRIAVMYLGEIVELAASHELYTNPKHPYTKALISAIPVPTLDNKHKRIILKGDVPSPVSKPAGCPFHTRCNSATDICKASKPILEKKADTNSLVACHLYK